jgi:ribosome-binding protein aMBF1 (putative translation factor)
MSQDDRSLALDQATISRINDACAYLGEDFNDFVNRAIEDAIKEAELKKSISLDESTVKRINDACSYLGEDFNDFVNRAIEDAIRDAEQNKG